MLEYINEIEDLGDMLDHFATSSQLSFNNTFYDEIVRTIDMIVDDIGQDESLLPIDKKILIDMIASLLGETSDELK